VNPDEDEPAENAVEDGERAVADELLKVSGQGTTVVAVVIRVTTKVLLAERGQLLTDEGHFVIVSTMVEVIVDVAEEAGADEVPSRGETTVEVFVVAGAEAVVLEYADVLLLGYKTIVVAVVTRVVVNVLRIVNGQLVIEAGHFVMVSTIVDNRVDVVNDAGTEEVLLRGETTVEAGIVLVTGKDELFWKTNELLLDETMEIELVMDVLRLSDSELDSVETNDIESTEVTVESEEYVLKDVVPFLLNVDVNRHQVV